MNAEKKRKLTERERVMIRARDKNPVGFTGEKSDTPTDFGIISKVVPLSVALAEWEAECKKKEDKTAKGLSIPP